LIKIHKYDIVHSHTSLGGVIARLASIGLSCKSLQTLHAFGADLFTPQPQKSIYWLIEKCLDFATDAYIAPSEYMKQYGVKLKLFAANKVNVVYNSLPLRPPMPDVVTSDRIRIRTTLNIDDKLVFLFCGRLEPQKGVDILIKSLAEDSLKGLEFVVLVCGQGDNEVEYKQLAAELGVDTRIIWLGWQTNVEQFYAACDIYVMPSRWESFGLVFLEAMNFKKPIIATNAQAIPEVVAHAECGLISDNENVAQLAENIRALAVNSHLCRQMGEAGFHRLSIKFSFPEFVDKTFNVYTSLVDDKLNNSRQ
ncbi:MAG: glycosyltransferase family 1 protein, partial [Sphingobacteriales bacterium]